MCTASAWPGGEQHRNSPSGHASLNIHMQQQCATRCTIAMNVCNTEIPVSDRVPHVARSHIHNAHAHAPACPVGVRCMSWSCRGPVCLPAYLHDGPWFLLCLLGTCFFPAPCSPPPTQGIPLPHSAELLCACISVCVRGQLCFLLQSSKPVRAVHRRTRLSFYPPLHRSTCYY